MRRALTIGSILAGLAAVYLRGYNTGFNHGKIVGHLENTRDWLEAVVKAKKT